MVFDYIEGGADDEITLRRNNARYRERVPGPVPWPGRSLSADEARALCASPRRAV